MYTGKITIKKTDETDLKNILGLWNNGEVMFFVGYPDGLGCSMEDMRKWYNTISSGKSFRHYSIYTDDLGYCGETGYALEENEFFWNGNCGIDIKLMPMAQGKGIAEYAIRKIIDEMLLEKVKYVSIWVDPNEKNSSAIKLYVKLGFKKNDFPKNLRDIGEDNGERDYMELKLSEYISIDKK